MVGVPMVRTDPSRPRRLPARTLPVWLAAAMVPGLAQAAGEVTGEQIYRQKCASSHGAGGEGTREEYPHPLAGDRTLPRLVAYIAKSMPDDAPGECVGEDAEKVGAYIFEAFYSKAAQARNKPARIELSHLTVN